MSASQPLLAEANAWSIVGRADELDTGRFERALYVYQG
jgi:hypothetical protein